MPALTIRDMLLRDEAKVPYAYQDSLEFWTIGVGHLIDKRRGGYLPDHLIDALLDWDIAQKSVELYKAAPWVEKLDSARRAVLVCMAFQLGVTGLMLFKRAMAHMQASEWEQAAAEFADSDVARKQAPIRWKRFCDQIRTGGWQ